MKRYIFGSMLIFGVGYFAWRSTPGHSPGRIPANQFESKVERTKKTGTRATPSRKAASVPETEKAKLVRELVELEKCYESRTCPFPETDPRSYELGLGQAIKQKLANFRERYRNDTNSLKERQYLAKKFIKTGDGFVKEEALKMFNGLPIASENLQAITAGLANSANPDLMTQVLPELQRYMGSKMEPQVHSFLTKTIASGGHFSSETVSQNILQFITPASYRTYEQTLQKMSEGARATKNLSWALREYRRLQTGA